MLYGLQDFSSPAKDWTQAPGSENTESYPLNHQGIPSKDVSEWTEWSRLLHPAWVGLVQPVKGLNVPASCCSRHKGRAPPAWLYSKLGLWPLLLPLTLDRKLYPQLSLVFSLPLADLAFVSFHNCRWTSSSYRISLCVSMYLSLYIEPAVAERLGFL